MSAALLCVAASSAKADGSSADFFRSQGFVKAASTSPKSTSPHLSRVASPRVGGATTTRASWYGGGERLSRRTASGEVFHPDAMTAAHRSLPLGTRLLVSANGRSIMVRVNDRGPAASTGRSLDLSRGAARALGIIRAGTARVSYRVAGL